MHITRENWKEKLKAREKGWERGEIHTHIYQLSMWLRESSESPQAHSDICLLSDLRTEAFRLSEG